MAERPSFKQAPAVDTAKKKGFLARMLDKLREKMAGHGSALNPVEKEERRSCRQRGLAGGSRAPERKNGAKEMARRVRQMDRGLLEFAA